MQIRITARHLQLSNGLREFAENEISRLEKYFDQILNCHLILDTERYKQVAELTVKVYGTVLTSKFKASDMRVAIEQVVEKAETQIKKYSSRLKEKNPRKIENVKNQGTSFLDA